MKKLFFAIMFAPLLGFAGEAEKAAASVLVETMQIEELIQGIINKCMKSILEIEPERAIREKEMKKVLTKYLKVSAMREMFINIYSESFTVDEIGDIIMFTSSQTGQKLLHKLPEIESKISRFILIRLQKSEKELSAILKDRDD